jgi:hypothetical protein
MSAVLLTASGTSTTHLSLSQLACYTLRLNEVEEAGRKLARSMVTLDNRPYRVLEEIEEKMD